jgi:hypothetical protein
MQYGIRLIVTLTPGHYRDFLMLHIEPIILVGHGLALNLIEVSLASQNLVPTL